MGITAAPSTGAIMRSLPLHKAGVSSAVNDTTRKLSGALGVAVLGSLVASHFRLSIHDAVSGLPGEGHALARRGAAARGRGRRGARRQSLESNALTNESRAAWRCASPRPGHPELPICATRGGDSVNVLLARYVRGPGAPIGSSVCVDSGSRRRSGPAVRWRIGLFFGQLGRRDQCGQRGASGDGVAPPLDVEFERSERSRGISRRPSAKQCGELLHGRVVPDEHHRRGVLGKTTRDPQQVIGIG